jgi:hypothetical protein
MAASYISLLNSFFDPLHLVRPTLWRSAAARKRGPLQRLYGQRPRDMAVLAI